MCNSFCRDIDETKLLESEQDLPIEEVLRRIYGDNPPEDNDENDTKAPSALKELFENGGADDEEDEEYTGDDEDEEDEEIDEDVAPKGIPILK